MKLSRIYLMLLSAVLICFFCCSLDQKPEQEKNPRSEIPEVLENGPRMADNLFRSGSKGRRYNLVEELYDEAMEKNNELRKLDDRIWAIKTDRKEILKAYHKYSSLNQDYWSSASMQLSSIKDTLLKNEVQEIFTSAETIYGKNLEKLETATKTIDLNGTSLEDQYALMKLFTSLESMMLYQSSRLPEVEPLNNLIQEYESLIKNCKDHNEIEK